MRSPILLVLVILAVGVAGFAALSLAWTSSRRVESPVQAPGPDVAALSARVDELSGDSRRLAAAIEELRAASGRLDRPETRIPVGEIEAAVARALEARLGAGGASVAAAAPEAARYDLKRALDRLAAEGLDFEEARKIWKELQEAGMLKEAFAIIEQRAKDRPNDVQAHLDLAQACLQRVFQTPEGPEKGMWAMKADKAYDAALAIDDHNWEARFSKAVSLTFWPPMFGKQPEAIGHFETLIQQQELQQPQADFAQTYLLLGNLHSQVGKTEKALAVWQKVLSIFPGNAELQAQIAAAQGH